MYFNVYIPLLGYTLVALQNKKRAYTGRFSDHGQKVNIILV